MTSHGQTPGETYLFADPAAILVLQVGTVTICILVKDLKRSAIWRAQTEVFEAGEPKTEGR